MGHLLQDLRIDRLPQEPHASTAVQDVGPLRVLAGKASDEERILERRPPSSVRRAEVGVDGVPRVAQGRPGAAHPGERLAEALHLLADEQRVGEAVADLVV